MGSWAWRASGIAQGFPEMLEIQGRSACNLKDNFAELAENSMDPKAIRIKFLAPKRPFTFFSCPLKLKKSPVSPLSLRFATIAAMSATSAVSGSPLTARQPTPAQAKVVFGDEIGIGFQICDECLFLRGNC